MYNTNLGLILADLTVQLKEEASMAVKRYFSGSDGKPHLEH